MSRTPQRRWSPSQVVWFACVLLLTLTALACGVLFQLSAHWGLAQGARAATTRAAGPGAPTEPASVFAGTPLAHARLAECSTGWNQVYVSATGDDHHSGQRNAPWRTIQRASDHAYAGTIVHVAPGVYRGSILSRPNGAPDCPIVYVSDARYGAHILSDRDPGGDCLYDPAHLERQKIWDIEADHVIVSGFDIASVLYADSGPKCSTRIGLYLNGSHDQAIDNRVHDIPGWGCQSDAQRILGGAGIDNGNYSAEGNVILNNVVFTIGAQCPIGGFQGIYLANRSATVYNNIVHDVPRGAGISTWHAAQDTIIVNNLVFHNWGGIQTGDGDGCDLAGTTTCPPATGLYVNNNIVVDNATFGITEFGASGLADKPNYYWSNLLYGNCPAHVADNASGLHMPGRCDQITRWVSLYHDVNGAIRADPEFVRYQADGGGDYHLLQGSPGAHQGTRVAAPAFDAEWETRTLANGSWISDYPSVGPYELRV